jgi:hypothetical protein
VQVIEQVERELEHVRPPLPGLGLQPRAERLGERRKVKEIVFLLNEHWRLAVDP